MSIGLIITAAGQSTRFSKDTHKILAPIHGVPLIIHTIMAFSAFDEIKHCIITVPQAISGTIKNTIKGIPVKFKILVISGRETRYESVAEAVDNVRINHTHLIIHDGARPNPSQALIRKIIDLRLKHFAVIPGIPVVDTIKEINSEEKVVSTLKRNMLRAIQTPQIFPYNELKDATKNASGMSYTDEAARMEALGFAINVINGERENIKVTYPEDIIEIERLMKPANVIQPSL